MVKKIKLKTKKAVLKRFKITKKGKILHRGHGSRHLKSSKSKKRIRGFRRLKEVKGAFKKKIRLLINK